MKSIRILLYAVNGLGLGHITRLLAIAKYLRRYAWLMGKESEIVFLSTSEVDTLPFLYGFPVIKIPSKTIVRSGGMNQQRYQKMAKMMIWNCISAHDPDILVVDTFPSGSFDELYDVMDFGFKKAFIYRPRKDHKKLWENPIIKAYDRILYIDEAYEIASESETEELLEDKIEHIGAIVQHHRSELLSREKACQQLGLDPTKKTACIMAGGGGDKDNQIFFERILPLLESIKDVQFVVAAGPLYRGAELPFQQGRWFYRPNISLYWNAFDMVISAGGFNSVNELVHAQIPALFFAQNRLYDDQQGRIDALCEQGLCLQFSVEQTNQEILVAIEKVLSDKQQKALKKALKKHDLRNEATDAALHILGLTSSEMQLTQVEDLLAMEMMQHFLSKGLEERTICKTIYAFSLFQEKFNALEGATDYLDNDEILDAVSLFLEQIVEANYPENMILPLLFTSIKKEELTTLKLLLEDLKYSMTQVL